MSVQELKLLFPMRESKEVVISPPLEVAISNEKVRNPYKSPMVVIVHPWKLPMVAVMEHLSVLLVVVSSRLEVVLLFFFNCDNW